MTNLRRDKYVSLEVLVRICEVLDCDIGDIVGVYRDDAAGNLQKSPTE